MKTRGNKQNPSLEGLRVINVQMTNAKGIIKKKHRKNSHVSLGDKISPAPPLMLL